VHLFGDRPDDLPRAQCFPGGHSSSGFALLALYFALRDRRPRAARWFLGGALAVGTLFAFGQEARGAHFLSHDLWSLGIAWFTCLAVYRLAFGGRVWSPLPGPPRAT
jgi:membrane-associated PAP2 superfamily phosphatase